VVSTLIRNIGTLVTGIVDYPIRDADSILIADGVFKDFGRRLTATVDRTIDARGTTVIPGLIDSHSHPTIGDFTPAQNAFLWITHYMHGGVTSIISAGELHLPGLPLPPDPLCAVSLAIVAKRCWDNLRPSGVKVYGGTLLLVPGLEEKDFDTIAEAGIRLVKFIFYDYGLLPNGEAQRYVKWARQRNIKVKIHSGGVSRSGVSQVAGVDIVRAIDPDVVGHSTGGPIPMPEEDLERIIAETDYFVEICTSGNPRMGLKLVEFVKRHKAFDRVLVGTDTPGGTGVVPRGILREICFLASVGGIAPEKAVAMATGNTGRAHGLSMGTIDVGQPADLVIMDKITGSVADSALDSFAKGDLPGISVVMIDGELTVAGRSEQTPPPERGVVIEEMGGNE
jgi:enamidase